jgi:hypothetical protein
MTRRITVECPTEDHARAAQLAIREVFAGIDQQLAAALSCPQDRAARKAIENAQTGLAWLRLVVTKMFDTAAEAFASAGSEEA